MRRAGHPLLPVLLVAPALALFCACTPQPLALDEIKARGELRVATLNSPTSYYEGAHGAEGQELELARALATQLGVALVMYPVADLPALKNELATHKADLVAAGLSPDDSWTSYGDTSRVYASVPQLVVYRRGGKQPRSTLQLESAKLAVRAGSAQERVLERLKATVAPNIEWVATAPRAADPLDDVSSGQADFAIVDAREFSFSRHLYPQVIIGFTLPEPRRLQWVVRRNAPDLREAVNEFFIGMERKGLLELYAKKSSGDARPFQYLESREFQDHVKSRLRMYKPWFVAAAQKSDVDWRLLAAIGYQESKWNPQAASGDGASGVMMLTAETATAMGVSDRSSPRESIFAGARYLAQVREKVPARIAEPDRTWLTLAAYNVGFGHVEDARILAQSAGKNPDSWSDVKEYLPLLAQERWYSRAKRGYARGWEPVQFVQRVQSYLRLLEWQPGEAVAGAGTRIEAPT
jgi:membrane-bound lytic murein transglycosylase F